MGEGRELLFGEEVGDGIGARIGYRGFNLGRVLDNSRGFFGWGLRM
jgi:hypothetical protein